MMVRPLAGSFCVAAILLLATAIGANAQAPTAQIDRVLFVPLGGLEQWISIRGEDRSNPVLPTSAAVITSIASRHQKKN
jgi:hypothetical protein